MLGKVTVEEKYRDKISKSFVASKNSDSSQCKKGLRDVLHIVKTFQPAWDQVVTKTSSIKHGFIKNVQNFYMARSRRIELVKGSESKLRQTGWIFYNVRPEIFQGHYENIFEK